VVPAPPVAPPAGPPGAAPTAGTSGPLSPAEQSRYDQITARRAQLQAAGEGDVSPEDLAELARYQSRGAKQTVAPLSPQERARHDQIVARQAQQRDAGEALDPSDSAELARYQQRMGQAGTGPAGGGPIDQTGAPIAAPTGGGGLRDVGAPAYSGPMMTTNTVPGGGPVSYPSAVAPQGMGVVRPGALTRSPETAAQQVASLVRANPPSRGGGWNDRDLQILNTIDAIYASPHKVQGWEQTSDDEKAFLASGAKKRGHSQNTFATKYAQSRIGQGSALA
jgi:hypothetical protein